MPAVVFDTVNDVISENNDEVNEEYDVSFIENELDNEQVEEAKVDDNKDKDVTLPNQEHIEVKNESIKEDKTQGDEAKTDAKTDDVKSDKIAEKSPTQQKKEMEVQVINLTITDDDETENVPVVVKNDGDKKVSVIKIGEGSTTEPEKKLTINGQEVPSAGSVIVNGDVVGVREPTSGDKGVSSGMTTSTDSGDVIPSTDLDTFETKIIKEPKHQGERCDQRGRRPAVRDGECGDSGQHWPRRTTDRGEEITHQAEKCMYYLCLLWLSNVCLLHYLRKLSWFWKSHLYKICKISYWLTHFQLLHKFNNSIRLSAKKHLLACLLDMRRISINSTDEYLCIYQTCRSQIILILFVVTLRFAYNILLTISWNI